MVPVSVRADAERGALGNRVAERMPCCAPGSTTYCLVLETRGHDHAQRVLGTLDNAGYIAQVLH